MAANKLSTEEVADLKYFWRLGAKNCDLAKAYDISRSTVTNHTTNFERHKYIQFCKNNHDTLSIGRLSDGRCRACIKIRNQKNYNKDLEKSRLLTRQYYQKHKNESADYHLKRNYGLSLAEKVALFNLQKGLCAGCDFRFESVHSACVDHNHSTKKIRELLCHACNRGLGFLGDSSNRLRRLADYLDRYK